MCSPGVTIDLVEVDVGRSSSDMSTSESSEGASRRGGNGALGGRIEMGIVAVLSQFGKGWFCQLTVQIIQLGNVCGVCVLVDKGLSITLWCR